MAKKIDSQKILMEHSKAKVDLLGRYLDRFLNIISNDGFTNRIKVYDLFCGEGVYDNGGEGSPIVIMNKVKNLHFINKAKNNNIPSVDVHFNDINPVKIEKLKRVINQKNLHYQEFGKLHFSNLDYKHFIEQLAKALGKSQKEKAFIFIDPYGYKEVKASEIQKLLEAKNSEVLLFLPTQFMYRFDKNGTPKALMEFIGEIVDYEKWEENTSVWSFIDQMKNGFRQYLGADFFVDTFTIQKDPKTVYCLFFFSSHIRGFEKMLEAKWELDSDQGRGWSYETTFDLFSSFKTNKLAEALEVFLKEEKKYNGDVYEFVLHQGFLPTHANEVFKNWQNKNKLLTLSDGGEKVRRSAFYISYDNYKNNPNRVYYKLN
ncbi:MAG: three-Cys-motif partner protein TcmP [Lewinellaceae bacterium]|nr:three-Cys-motif partner protein TcmP [Lewinellaceae bacterium]